MRCGGRRHVAVADHHGGSLPTEERAEKRLIARAPQTPEGDEADERSSGANETGRAEHGFGKLPPEQAGRSPGQTSMMVAHIRRMNGRGGDLHQ